MRWASLSGNVRETFISWAFSSARAEHRIGDRELLKLMIEVNRAADLAVAASKLRTAFEVRPTVEISIPGMPRNRVDFGGLAANSGDSNLNMSFSRIPL
jgi:hypothetical protein